VQTEHDHKHRIAEVNAPKNVVCIALITSVCIVIAIISSCNKKKDRANTQNPAVLKSSSRTIPADAWKAPDSTAIPAGKAGDIIRYGKELLAHTARYFGPNGSVAKISNGMNCQNCHLEGGRRLFGNNYASFIANYPKMNNRSGKIDQPTDRIIQCFNRSMAGHAPDTNGHEVQAMLAYMRWIGQGVKKGGKLFGAASEKLTYMDRAADPAKGKMVFVSKCITCHGSNGEGVLAADKRSYTYPPLWGEHSYNNGAGMYRIGNLAGFVKNNMPFGASYQHPQLTDEEAWDVAAFVNSQPRPHFDQRKDWKDLKTKPVDFPFGPYADGFSEKQHKYGPFKPIAAAQKQLTNKRS
jgi:thiosulfate dehydrogenase